LRPFLGQATLEQLRIPFYTVAVDLVTGQTVVREQGDAVHAVLESINLPVISRPILRDGMALVDGGILNNLPADVLVEHGANFVVGIDVASRLRQSFAGNTPGMSTESMRRPGTIETLLRVNEVQDLSVSLLRTAAVDLLITPDTSAFEFADFTRTAELADVGEIAAKAVLPQLKQMLAELEGCQSRAR
jgi:predicted acylesterase/phospholipase RssA